MMLMLQIKQQIMGLSNMVFNDILITSFVSGLIGSLFALCINTLLSRPRLALSTEIVCGKSIEVLCDKFTEKVCGKSTERECGKSTEKGSDKRYLIKMMNKSPIFRIYNISIYEFYHLKHDNYYVTQIKPIPYLEKWKIKQERRGLIAILNGPKRKDSKKSENHNVEEFSKRDNNDKYENQDIEEFLIENPGNYVEVVIICSSRFGGVKDVFRQQYHFAALRKGYGFVATSVKTYKLENALVS